MNGLYEAFSRPTSDYDWIDICMADLFGIDPHHVIPPMPPELEVFQHRSLPRKSALFAPEQPTVFDIESGPLINKDYFTDSIPQKATREPSRSKRSVVFDVESIPLKEATSSM